MMMTIVNMMVITLERSSYDNKDQYYGSTTLTNQNNDRDNDSDSSNDKDNNDHAQQQLEKKSQEPSLSSSSSGGGSTSSSYSVFLQCSCGKVGRTSHVTGFRFTILVYNMIPRTYLLHQAPLMVWFIFMIYKVDTLLTYTVP